MTTEGGSSEIVEVVVDPEVCIGGGQCEMLEEEIFVLDDDSMISSVVGTGQLPRDRAELVVDRCPGRAISIVESKAT